MIHNFQIILPPEKQQLSMKINTTREN